MQSKLDYSKAQSILLLASEDTDNFEPSGQPTESDPLIQKSSQLEPNQRLDSINDVNEVSILQIPHIFPIEFSLLINVLLASFDMTITASTYTTIGSEFNAVDISSWITTSYMITSTSFQPLYGAFSDVLGRRNCYLFATIMFSLGCVGCAYSRSILSLFIARAVTGIGGGGLITLATVVNSDIIPVSKRGLFQGFQNILLGIGSILGASLGGVMSETIGWRYCFLVQVPLSIMGLVFGYFYIHNQSEWKSKSSVRDIDIQGSLLLVSGLTLQLLALYSYGVSAYLFGFTSLVTLVIFVKVELNTEKAPIVPFAEMQRLADYLTLLIATLAGFVHFAYIFVLPLLFQIVLGDTPSTAGFRLALPSTFTSVGALITAYIMNKNIRLLNSLVLAGVLLMLVGNSLVLLVSNSFPQRFLNLLLIPANVGLGISYPACLFTFVFSFPREMHASSTSTLFLFRSVGQVWGVAIVSTVVQTVLQNNLLADPLIDDSLIPSILKSISFIKRMSPELQQAVTISYESAIRFAQTTTILVCILTVIFSIGAFILSIRRHDRKR